MTNQRLTPQDLAQFTGTENWYRHGLVRGVVYTDGVKFLAEAAGAYWLIDKIATLQLVPAVCAEPFQFWKLEEAGVGEGGGAVLICDDGNGNIVWHERIHYTDFPFEGGVNPCTLYFCDGVILLPSEY